MHRTILADVPAAWLSQLHVTILARYLTCVLLIFYMVYSSNIICITLLSVMNSNNYYELNHVISKYLDGGATEADANAPV